MKHLISALYVVGAAMVLLGAAVYVTGWPLAPYVYTVGAVCFACAQICTPCKDGGTRIRRLRRQQILGAVALVLTGVFMFLTRGNEWIVCLTIAAVLQLYTAIRIPQEADKHN